MTLCIKNYLKRLPWVVRLYDILKSLGCFDEKISKRQATYFDDGFATTHFVGFLQDEKFINAYMNAWDDVPEYVRNTNSKYPIAWRAHILCWAANQALKLEGDFVECGVWYGVLSKTITGVRLTA